MAADWTIDKTATPNSFEHTLGAELKAARAAAPNPHSRQAVDDCESLMHRAILGQPLTRTIEFAASATIADDGTGTYTVTVTYT